MFKRFAGKWVGAVTAVGFVALLGAFDQRGQRVGATRLSITGNDYAFVGVPVSVRAGQVFFSFTNKGKVRHEMALTRVKEGVTAEAAIAGVKGGGRRRDFVEGAAVLVVAAPGEESSRARLVLDVRKGETYLVSCTLKDSPDAVPHIMLGMYTSFRVE